MYLRSGHGGGIAAREQWAALPGGPEAWILARPDAPGHPAWPSDPAAFQGLTVPCGRQLPVTSRPMWRARYVPQGVGNAKFRGQLRRAEQHGKPPAGGGSELGARFQPGSTWL